ncbi:MAG: alpha/beta hydrolase [Bacteroidota bacterium]
MRLASLAFALLLAWSTVALDIHAASNAARADTTAIVTVPFVVDIGGLGGVETEGALTHPSPDGRFGPGPYPVVLLIHGNGPQDMDATLPTPEGPQRLFYDLAHALSARGFAVVRYHKRFVYSNGRINGGFWEEQSTVTFTDDADKVLNAALALGPADADRVFVYGWSEGTAVGAALSARRLDVDGLITHGAVGLPYRDMAHAWIAEVGATYARSFAASDTITAASLRQAGRGSGGMVAKLGAAFLTDPSFQQTGQYAVSRYVDADGDEQLSPAEVETNLGAVLDFMFSQAGNLYIYADGRTVPTVTEQAEALAMPVLILQGEHDASTPVRGAQALHDALRTAGNSDVTLKLYPGLGHALGPAASLTDDIPRPMPATVIDDIVQWLQDRSGE